LLGKIISAFHQMGHYCLLFMMVMYIFAMVGMEFFANKLHFDPVTGNAIKFGEPGYADAYIPQYNFDTFLWALVTVYSTLTFDIWVQFYYKCRIATGAVASVYFIVLICVGFYIMRYIFVQVLVSNFMGEEVDIQKIVAPRAFRAIFQAFVSKLKRFLKCFRKKKRKRKKRNPRRRISLHAKILDSYQAFVTSKRFNRIAFCAVFLNTACICLQNPLGDPHGMQCKVLSIINSVFIVIFCAEFLGRFIGDKEYLLDLWNLFDFCIIILTFLTVFVLDQPNASLVTVVRTIQPLRMVTQSYTLRHISSIVLRAIPTVLNLATICGLFFLMFSIFAVSFLKGSLDSCHGQMDEDRLLLLTFPLPWESLSQTQVSWFANTTCSNPTDFPMNPTSHHICNCWFRKAWSSVLQYPSGFNNVLMGFYTFMVISTGSGWNTVMIAAVNQRGVNMQPFENANKAWVLFFCVVTLFCSFFLLNIFAGSITCYFTRHQHRSGSKMSFSTPAELKWLERQLLVKRMKSVRPAPPSENWFLCFCFKMVFGESQELKDVKKTYFEKLVSFVIIVNGAALALTFFGQSSFYLTVDRWLVLVCTFFFNLEAFFRVVALRKYYFLEHWNIFDLTVVVITDIVLILGKWGNVPSNFMTSFGRIMRLLRLLQVAKSLKGAEGLILTLLSSLAGFLNIGALLLVLFCVFGIGAKELFGKVSSTHLIYPDANFRSIGASMITLFWIATGDHWSSFTQTLSEDPPGCQADPPFNPNWCERNNDAPGCVPLNGCSSSHTFLFFYMFKVSIAYIVANLFIGTILDSMASPQTRMKTKLITEDVISEYNILWSKHDPLLRNIYPAYLLPQFLRNLPEPLGLPEQDRNDHDIILSFIESLHLPDKIIVDGLHYYEYEELTTALSDAMLERVQYASLKEAEILIVDSSAYTQQLTHAVLKTAGYTCHVASDGQEAVDMASLHQYQLIFMNDAMPGMTGVEATQKITHFDKSVTIVGLIGATSHEEEHEIIKAGAKATLVKPVKKAEILHTCSSFIQL